MRILHCTLSFSPGGRRRAITTLAERLRVLGETCDLCCLDELGCDLAEAAGAFDEVTALRRHRLLDLGALRRLIAFCDARHTAVIHAHDGASQFTGSLLRLWRPHVKLLMTFHRSLGCDSALYRDRARNAWACALSGAVVTGSRERRAHFLDENFVSRRKVVRIPFGIDVDHFRPNPAQRVRIRQELGVGPETVVLGAVGHFGPEKGVDQAIRGFAALSGRALPSPVVLVIVGRGTPAQRETLEALAHRQHTGPVVFAGYRTDVEHWLQGMDLFVHTPRIEAFGLAVVEAMAAGLPIVATAVGGVVDLVRPRQNGLLVPAEEPVLLADALEQLVRNPRLREKLGEAAHRIAVEEYGADLYARRYLRLYQDLVTNRPPQGISTGDHLAEETEVLTDHVLPALAGGS
jgi:glycosyltransferase involved in cell wall biosynthesis